MSALRFDTPPRANLLRAALHRPRPPRDLVIPRIEVSIARATLPADPSYRRLCGFAGDTPPITAPHLLAGSAHIAIVSHPDMPLPAMGLVHVHNVITAHRPLEAGMPLRLAVFVEGHRHVRAGAEFDVHTHAFLGEELVWEEVSTYLSRAVPGNKAPREDEPGPLRDLTVSTHWSLPPDLGRRYARASGDFNPIHLTAPTAKLFGFKRAIIHGMWTLARGAAQLGLSAPGTLTCTFRRPAMLPSTVFFHATADGRFQVRSARRGKLLLNGAVG